MLKRVTIIITMLSLLMPTWAPAFAAAEDSRVNFGAGTVTTQVYTDPLPLPDRVPEAPLAIPETVSGDLAKTKLAQAHQISESEIQEYLDEGYTIQDIAQALQGISAQMSFRKVGGGIRELLQLVAPKPVNRSAEAKSEIDLQLEGEASVLRDVYGQEIIQITESSLSFQGPLRSDVTSVVYDVYSSGSFEMPETGFLMAAAAAEVEFNPDGYHQFNTAPDQAPFTINTGAENMSTMNGGFTLTAADLTLPGRNGLSFGLTRMYNSDSSKFYAEDAEIEHWGRFDFQYDYYSFLQYMKDGVITESPRTFHNDRYVAYNNHRDYGDHWNWVGHNTDKSVPMSGWRGPDANGTYNRDMVYIPANPDRRMVQERYDDWRRYSYRDKVVAPRSDKKIPIGVGWDWDIPNIEKRTVPTNNGSIDFYYLNLGSKGSYQIDNNKLLGAPWLDLKLTGGSQWGAHTALVTLEGVKYLFNSDGELTRILDAYGNHTDFTYITEPRYGKVLSRITDAIGNAIHITYLSDRVEVVLGDRKVTYKKRTVEYYYPNAPWKNITKEILEYVEDPMGRRTTYSYSLREAQYSLLSAAPSTPNPYVLLTGVVHPTGAATYYTYESLPTFRYQGKSAAEQVFRVINRKDAVTLSNGTQQIYNEKNVSYAGDIGGSNQDSDYTFYVTVNDGRVVTRYENFKDFIHTSIPERPVHTKTMVQTETLPNGTLERITEYTPDTVRRLSYPIAEKSYTKKTVNGTVTQSEAVTTSVEYDGYGNIVRSVDPLGGIAFNEYDPATHLLVKSIRPLGEGKTLTTVYERNAQGKITRASTFGDTTKQIRYENFDAYGNATRIRVMDATGDNVYDVEYGAQTHYAFPTKQTIGITNADGQSSTIVRTYAYNPVTGRLASYKDGNQYTTAYQYDKLGRVTQVTYPNAISSIQYDDIQNMAISTDETSVKTYVKWNPLGLKVEDGFMEGAAYRPRTKYGYDQHSRPLFVEDAIGQRTQTAYDAWNRAQRTTYPDLSYTQYAYDDIQHTQTVTDPEGNVYRNLFDPYGRLIRKEENGVRLESYVYDHLGNVTERRDGKDQLTRYRYDAFGQLLAVIDPEGHETGYRYSPVGQHESTIYPDGSKVQKQYDQMGRMIRKTTGIAADPSAAVVYQPDTILNQWSLVKNETNEPVANKSNLWSSYDGFLTSKVSQSHPFKAFIEADHASVDYDERYVKEVAMADYGLGASNLSVWRSGTGFDQTRTYYLPNPANFQLPLKLPATANPKFQTIQGMLYFMGGNKLYIVNTQKLQPRIEDNHDWKDQNGYTHRLKYSYSGNPYDNIVTVPGTIVDYIVTNQTFYVVYSLNSLYYLSALDPYTGKEISDAVQVDRPTILLAIGDDAVLYRYFGQNKNFTKINRRGQVIANQVVSTIYSNNMYPFQGPDGSIYFYDYGGSNNPLYVSKVNPDLVLAWRTRLLYNNYNLNHCSRCDRNMAQSLIFLPAKNQLIARSNGPSYTAQQVIDLNSGAILSTVNNGWYSSPPTTRVNWNGDLLGGRGSTTVDNYYLIGMNLYDGNGAAQGTIPKDLKTNYIKQEPFPDRPMGDGFNDANFTETLYDGFINDGLYAYIDLLQINSQARFEEWISIGVTLGQPTTHSLTRNLSDFGHFVSGETRTNASYEVTVKTTTPRGIRGVFGASFRMANVSNRYALEFDGKQVDLVKYVSGVRHVLGSKPYMLQAHTEYRVQTHNSGSSIAIRINDQLLFQVQDSSLASGKFGLFSNQDGISFGALTVKDASANGSGAAEKYHYDANSNLIRQIDRKGQTITYGYDSRNRVTSETSPSGTVTWTYDAAGRRKTMTDLTGTTGYDYKPTTGELAKMTYPDGRFIAYVTDNMGRRETMTDPFGYATYYRYDNRNRVDGIGLGVNNYDASYQYYKNDLLKKITLRNGNTANYTYDGAKLDTLIHRKADNAVIHAYDYDYDLNQNISRRVEDGAAASFTYDPLDRIKTSSPFNETYTYNSRGNRTSLQTDRPMNLATASYEYDAKNRLTKAVQNGRVVTYKYNGDGLLYERTENGATTRYYYDGAQVIAEGAVSGTSAAMKARYIRGGSGLIARQDSAGKQFYLHNGHGDVVELRDASGNTRLNQYTYDIWGNPIVTEESVANPFRYSGELWDSTTGLQYLRARWYDPNIGRFINEDTYEGELSNPLTLNLYTYVHNNPLRYTDPSGHCILICDAELTKKALEFGEKTGINDFIDDAFDYAGIGASANAGGGGGKFGGVKAAAKTAWNAVKKWIGKSDEVVKGADKVIEINNPVLDSVRTGSALKLDAQHAFNDIIDNYASSAQKFNLVGGDKVTRELYQIEGSLNGKQGVFEWIVDPDPLKGVTHRRFIEDVGVTGKPNATAKR